MQEEKIFKDYKEAMKSKDNIKSSTLSFLRAELMNEAIEKRKKTLDDKEVIAVIKRQIKQHQDSIEQFKKGKRQDLVDKETKELEVLKTYLPPELSEAEIKQIIEVAVVAVDAEGLQDIGKVMKEVMAKTAGRADGKLVSDLVRMRLSKPAA